jgi:hypothetical protein
MKLIDKMLNDNKGFKLAHDCTDNEILIVIKFIINSKINDSNKKNLIQQFLLNWLTILEINERI